MSIESGKRKQQGYLNHANVVEVSLSKGSYPGYWWVYTKSMIADDPDGNNSYDFSDANYLFASPSEGGYDG